LAKKKNLRTVRKSLGELPEKLDDIYHEAMKRIKQQDADDECFALRLLSWIVYSVRPLDLTEIRHAMAIDDLAPVDRSVPQDILTPPAILVNACAGIVRLDEETNTIRLIHETTQKYFERTGSDHFPRARHDIGVACIKYLSLDVFGDGYCLTDELYERRLKDNPLFDYAAKNWGNHIREGNEQDIPDLASKFLLNDIKLSSSNQVLLGYKLLFPRYGFRPAGYSQHFPKKFQGVHLMAYFGVKDMMTKLLSENPKIDPDAKDENGRTPLLWAARGGHGAIVQALLATGKVNPNTKDRFGQTPLLWAAYLGAEAVIQALLATGKVNLDIRDRLGQTPLSWAAYKGDEAIFQALLATGKADPDAKDNNGQTPLSWAARMGHKIIVQALLATGKVDPDAKDKDGQTPLSWTARTGNEVIVQTLLATGKVDPDAKDKDGQTPLLWAAREGHEAVVQTLLATGKVNPDAETAVMADPP
jgi:ankyrin repeat protein